MGRKRSLADDLADFATTAPSTEVDIDRDELGQSAALVESDEGEEELQHAKRAKKVPERGLRLRADIDLEKKEYAGKKTTRASVFGQESDDVSGSSSSEADGVTEDESDDRASDGKTALSEEDAGPGTRTATSSEGDDGLPESDSQTTKQASGDGSEGGRIYAEARALDATVVDHMKARLAKDRAKASAAKAQHAIWERLLEMRILLQKALTASHQLPERQVVPAIVDSSADTAAVYQELQEVSRGTITELLNLHAALVHQNPALEAESDDANAEEAGGEAELWQKLHGSYSRLRQFRDSSLDRWYCKALLGSGHLALKGNLRLLNQSVSSQVASMMLNPERLIKRAQLPLSQAPRQLFSQAPAGEPAQGVESDPERYDDSEFYQQLLKQFLEANSSAASLGATLASRGKKSRNTRDRRASKGRRLRYDVQEKLVNFMVARKYEEPPMANQLFRNLFGQSAI